MHIVGGQIIPCVFHVHIGGKVPALHNPSQHDGAGVAAHVLLRGSNSEHAPVHLPRVSVSVSSDAPDAHYRDGAVACAGGDTGLIGRTWTLGSWDYPTNVDLENPWHPLPADAVHGDSKEVHLDIRIGGILPAP